MHPIFKVNLIVFIIVNVLTPVVFRDTILIGIALGCFVLLQFVINILLGFVEFYKKVKKSGLKHLIAAALSLLVGFGACMGSANLFGNGTML